MSQQQWIDRRILRHERGAPVFERRRPAVLPPRGRRRWASVGRAEASGRTRARASPEAWRYSLVDVGQPISGVQRRRDPGRAWSPGSPAPQSTGSMEPLERFLGGRQTAYGAEGGGRTIDTHQELEPKGKLLETKQRFFIQERPVGVHEDPVETKRSCPFEELPDPGIQERLAAGEVELGQVAGSFLEHLLSARSQSRSLASAGGTCCWSCCCTKQAGQRRLQRRVSSRSKTSAWAVASARMA